jgi:primosomal protein N'
VEAHETRENFCRACGSTNLRAIRSGITTLARDIAAQLNQPVSEVSASSDQSMPLERVVVGTEAIWQRVRRCGLVIFVDFDQYLLAPRENSRIAALTAIAKAGRLVGARTEARGEVLVQTRRGEDLVLSAATGGDLSEVLRDEVETAELLGLPPFGFRCEISGENAQRYVDTVNGELVRIRQTNAGFEISAPDVDVLSQVLANAKHPGGRLRIARN